MRVGPVVRRLDAAAAGERVDDQVLRPGGVRHSQADGEHELLRLVGDLQRPEVLHPARLLGLEVHLGHEELHVLADVGLERGGGLRRDAVAVLAEPGLEPLGLLRPEDEDVVLAHAVLRLDADAERLVALLLHARALRHVHGRRCAGHGLGHRIDHARVGIEVLHQPRRGVRVEVLEQLPLTDVDLLALQHRRHRDHQRELGQGPAVVVAHGEHGAIAVTHQRHLRRVVEQLGVGLPHVEAAEREGGGRVQQHQQGHDQKREDTTDGGGGHGDDSLVVRGLAGGPGEAGGGEQPVEDRHQWREEEERPDRRVHHPGLVLEHERPGRPPRPRSRSAPGGGPAWSSDRRS